MTEQYIYFNCPPSPYYLESGEVYYQKGDSHPNRANLALFDLIVVKEGCLYLGEEDGRWEVRAGEALILLPQCYHYSVKPVEVATTFYWVHFQSVNKWAQTEEASMMFLTESHQQCFNPKSYTMKVPKYMKLAFPQQTYQLLNQMNNTQHLLEPKAYWQRQQSFEALLYLLDERQYQENSTQLIKLAERVELYLRNHYKEAVTNESLSRLFNYHYNYITRAMKHAFHYSPHDYIVKLRIDEAKLMLLHSFAPIKEIALEIGFENVPYFTNCFKKQTGMTPTQFRKQFRH